MSLIATCPAGIGMKPRANGTLATGVRFPSLLLARKNVCFSMSVQTPEPESLELPPNAEKRVPSAVTVLLAVLVLFAALTAAYVAAEVILQCSWRSCSSCFLSRQ